MKVYNVWVEVERIDEANEDNGEDIVTEKIAKFKMEKKAVDFALSLVKENNTARDKNSFTI